LAHEVGAVRNVLPLVEVVPFARITWVLLVAVVPGVKHRTVWIVVIASRSEGYSGEEQEEEDQEAGS
jgi:general stress protein CsbA